VATIVVPVYATSVARLVIALDPDDNRDHECTLDAEISEEVTTVFVPSPATTHLLPVYAIPLPCIEKSEFDSRTLRHVPGDPLMSTE
jgi:hypothetical protein